MSARQNVLIITSLFPPEGGAGSLRTIKYIKYLPSFGWRPIVLTLAKKGKLLYDADFSLNDDLPKELGIYRTGFFTFLLPLLYDLRDRIKECKFTEQLGIQYIVSYMIKAIFYLLVPDAIIGWFPFALAKSKQVFKENKIDIIYSTSPSEVTHLIANHLAKKYNVPWVAEFQDPWLKAFWKKLKSPIRFKLNLSLERSVLNRTNKIVVAAPKIIDEFKEIVVDFDISKCTVILNGYDEEDFAGIVPKKFEKFTIVYAGSFHKKAENPEVFFEGLSSLFVDEPEIKEESQIIIVGRIQNFIRDLIRKYDLESNVKLEGFLPHKKALEYLCGASALFFMLYNFPDDDKKMSGKHFMSSKLFEYLRAKRPILSLIPGEADVAEIIKRTKSGIIINPKEKGEIKQAILEMYRGYKENVLTVDRKDDSILSYEKKELTKKLAGIFNDALTESSKV